MYVYVPVREDRVPAVLELLATPAARAATDQAAMPVEGKLQQEGSSPSNQGIERLETTALSDVSEEGRTVLRFLARRSPDERIGYKELEAESGVPNLGAALQSVSIRSTQHGVPPLIEKRRGKGGFTYSMDARTAAIVREFFGGE